MINNSKSNNSRAKYDMLYNFYGICNGIFPMKEKNLLEKKRKNSQTNNLIEEKDENDPKKSNINEGINVDKKNSGLKLNYYEKEIKINDIDDTENKGDIIEEINLEEIDKVEDTTAHKNENELEFYIENDENNDNNNDNENKKRKKRKKKKKGRRR